MKTQYYLIPLLLLVFATGCGGTTEDENYARSIIGTWRDSTSANMAARARTYIFKANGEIEYQVGREHTSVKDFVDGKDDPNFMPAETGTWGIKNGWLNYQITNSNLNNGPYEPRKYEIIEIAADKLLFRASDGQQTYFRVKDE